MEYKLKAGVQGHVYFPKKILKVFGENMNFLPNAHAAVIYAEDTDPETVIASLRVIITDLELRCRLKKKANK